MTQLGEYPITNSSVEFTPVDYVSKALVALRYYNTRNQNYTCVLIQYCFC